MVDFSRLSENWYRWAPAMGGAPISIATDCEDCDALFSTADYSVHLRKEEHWWIVDTVNDRGQRRSAAAKLSNFDLAQKYLIWDWATTARSSLAEGPLGADLYRLGYAPGVTVCKAERGYKISRNDECAVLSIPKATIFSHLITKSVDEIQHLVMAGLE